MIEGVYGEPSLKDVGCFVQVAAGLSFSRAAARLGSSQPAVSQAVARLERDLGLRLFERNSREVRLTEAGRVLLPEARALLEQATALTEAAARLVAPSGAAIRFAYCPLIGMLAAQVVRRLAGQSPAVGVELRAAGWSAAAAGLAEGTFNAAIISTPFPPELAATARFHVPVTHVAVPAGEPIATASVVRMDQLAGYRMLISRGLRTQLSGDEVDDIPAALDLVAAGGAAALPVPRLLVEAVRRPDVRFLPLAGAHPRLTYGLVWRRDRATAELMTLVHVTQRILRRS